MKNYNTVLKNTDHCALCDLRKANLTLGLICSLTNSPPGFDTTCSNIKLDILFNHQTKELQEKIEELNFSKYRIYQNLIIYVITGIATLALCYIYYIKKIKPHGILRIDVTGYGAAASFAVLALLFILGFALIGNGIQPLVAYNRTKESTINKLDKIETLISLYQTK
ncbi:hypothetical protein [uncultured Tenacibaculum sp.]|uniref:hypothetical protein n=1 Tax=uncultured Tenacibaculum sp. TaxID=174713 RepID=UPI0026305E91|nr:hypothetical protein [uncultured Tenacibaculum sp.]